MRGAFYMAITLFLARSRSATAIDQLDVSQTYLNVGAIGGEGTKLTPKRYLRDGLALSAANEERVKANVLSKSAKTLAAEGEDWLRLSLGTGGHSHPPKSKRKVNLSLAKSKGGISKKVTTPKQRVYKRHFVSIDPRLPGYLKVHQTFRKIFGMPHEMSLTEAVLMYGMVNWKHGSSPATKKIIDSLLRLAERSNLADFERALDPMFVRIASLEEMQNEYFHSLQTMYAKVYAFCHAHPADCTNKKAVSPLERMIKAQRANVILPPVTH
uniref:Secreted RxLR effector protein 5 n=1 Tax=Plasmopara viticola TaxID=143451 RepID=RLR5_PLAVT|nr:RecName: Full=Secreted RxLR effector protein 5; Flags: Precursor [Plasmopara viticola]ANC73368.1 secreted RxLR effector peptide protein 5 [Plasmopara viticola]